MLVRCNIKVLKLLQSYKKLSKEYYIFLSEIDTLLQKTAF